MKKRNLYNRRNFLKNSLSGTAGIIIAGSNKAFSRQNGWTSGLEINPAIDNLRVVCCHDPKMVLRDPNWLQFQQQHECVDPEVIGANMDEMAKTLAQRESAQEAWAAIFRKPETKQWDEVKVAIKVNCAAYIHPRAAVVDKICRVLNGFGVPFPNITIYDILDNAEGKYGILKGDLLPSDVIVSNGTDLYPVTVWGEEMFCSMIVVESDILVNCAVNKPHDDRWAFITMCCKNHVGTVIRGELGQNCPNGLDQLFALNKHEVIIGNSQSAPQSKQQLCIVDSLWSSAIGGYAIIPDASPSRLVMGTFAPAVDYLTAKKIREDILGCTHPAQDLDRYITDFGYEDAERQEIVNLIPEQNRGRGWVEVAPASENSVRPDCRTKQQSLEIELLMSNSGSRSKTLRTSLYFGGEIISVSIFTTKGRLVYSFPGFQNKGNRLRLLWNGTTDSGTSAGKGTYLLKIQSRTEKKFTHFSYF